MPRPYHPFLKPSNAGSLPALERRLLVAADHVASNPPDNVEDAVAIQAAAKRLAALCRLIARDAESVAVRMLPRPAGTREYKVAGFAVTRARNVQRSEWEHERIGEVLGTRLQRDGISARGAVDELLRCAGVGYWKGDRDKSTGLFAWGIDKDDYCSQRSTEVARVEGGELMADIDLSGYVEVKDRVLEFYAKYPDGRIVATPPVVVTVADRSFVAVTASVYRTPDDPTPCTGSAWEPFPGKTPYTRDSEAMNAETSAWGRALAAAGIGTQRSMASRDEVRSRQTPPEVDGKPTPAMTAKVQALFRERGINTAEDKHDYMEALLSRAVTSWKDLSRDEGSQVIAALESVPPTTPQGDPGGDTPT